MTDIGTALTVHPDGSHREHAAELEELGYRTLWISGGQIDRLDRIAETVRATRRATVAPGIIMTGVYGSEEVAALYRELEDEHPGRFLVGLGAPQDSPHPTADLESYLDRLDADVPRERRILAAIGPRRLALARERFAGAVPLMVTPEHTAGARDVLGPDRTLAVQQFVVLDDDADRARAAARGTLGFLLGVKGYADNVRRMGFSDADVETISDRLVDAVVAHGGPEVIAQRVAAHRAAGADHVAVSPLGDDPLETSRRLAPVLLG